MVSSAFSRGEELRSTYGTWRRRVVAEVPLRLNEARGLKPGRPRNGDIMSSNAEDMV
jgi:hypothetical protein